MQFISRINPDQKEMPEFCQDFYLLPQTATTHKQKHPDMLPSPATEAVNQHVHIALICAV